MVNSNRDDKVHIHCPQCLRELNANVSKNGVTYGVCPVCKATFSSKFNTPKEKIIKIYIN